jgi:4'-phosphopantetheinyl transferase
MLTGTQVPALPAGVTLHVLHDMPDATQLAWLSPRERARGDRFHFEHHRRRFLAAHCALRATLSRHTGTPPSSLQFIENPFGKPLLAGVPDCQFNLSHSDDLALLVISDTGPVGVDIEMLRPMRDALSLAEANFSASEYAEFLAVDPRVRDEVFLRVWTRKEACLKAVGIGLSQPPSSVDVGLDAEARRLSVTLPGGRTAQLTLGSFAAAPGSLGAVAHVLGMS